MKIYQYFLGLAVVMLGVFTSCNTDVEGDCYTPTWQNISFETATPATITTSETSLTIPVRLIRSNTQGAYTANFSSEASEDGIFSVEGGNSVSFAEGQGVIEIKVKADNLAKGKDYTYTLKLGAAEEATADTLVKIQNLQTVISIHSDYTWTALGKAHYSSPEWWEEELDVDVEQAVGTNIYRLKSLFEKGYDIQFSIEPDNRVIVPKQGSWEHSTYGVVSLQGYLYEDDSNVAGLYDPATKTAPLTLRHTVSAGSFGAFTDVLTMP